MPEATFSVYEPELSVVAVPVAGCVDTWAPTIRVPELALVTTPLIADWAEGLGDGDGLGDDDGLGEGDGLGDGLGLGEGDGDGDGGAARAVTVTLSTSNRYRLMTSMAPWENVESETEAILLPLMNADSDVPTTSISSWYQVDVL